MLQGSGIPITLLNRRATVRRYVLVLCSLDNDPVLGDKIQSAWNRRARLLGWCLRAIWPLSCGCLSNLLFPVRGKEGLCVTRWNSPRGLVPGGILMDGQCDDDPDDEDDEDYEGWR